MARDYTTEHSFYWSSIFSKERQEEIGDWVESLPEEDYKKLQDIVFDARMEAESEADEDASL